MASEHLDTILRSGYEAQAHRRRIAASNDGGMAELNPDEGPTFTHPVSPGLDSTHRYTTSPPMRRRTNPWSLLRESSSSESGDDCDRPLTRSLSHNLSRRLSRRASSALSKFNLQRAPTDADEEELTNSSEGTDRASEPSTKKQPVPLERRRSSLQKIKDFVTGRRKDSAMSDNALTNVTTPDEDQRAMRSSELLGTWQRAHDVSSGFASFNMTRALPASSSDFVSLESGANGQQQIHILEQPIHSSDDSSGGEGVSPTTGLQMSPFLPVSETNTGAEWTQISYVVDNSSIEYAQNLKRKRSRGISSIHIPRLPSIGSILQKERSFRSPKAKLKRREPGLTSPLGGHVPTDPWIGHTTSTNPVHPPASIDEIGVLPPSSMESALNVSAPVYTTDSSTSSSATVRTPSPSLPVSKKEGLHGCPSSPHLEPVVAETVPSGSSFVLPSPYVPLPSRRHKPIYPYSTSPCHPSRSVQSLCSDGDCLSIDATISDLASVREELPLRRMGIFFHELREAASFTSAAVQVPDPDGGRPSVGATVLNSIPAFEDSPLRRMEVVLNQMREAAAFRNKAERTEQASTDDDDGLHCLTGLEGMEGTSFARGAVEWAEKGTEQEGESDVSEGADL